MDTLVATTVGMDPTLTLVFLLDAPGVQLGKAQLSEEAPVLPIAPFVRNMQIIYFHIIPSQ